MKRKLLVLLSALSLAALPSQGALLIRELFDGLQPSLNGVGDSASSVGFESGTTWLANRTDAIKVANNFNVNPNITNQLPVLLNSNGGVWWSVPGTGNWDTDWWATRQLAAGSQVNFNADGVYYITYNMRRRDDCAVGFGFTTGSANTSQFVSVGATWNNTGFNSAAARRLVAHRGTLNVGQGPCGASAWSATQVNVDDRNLVLIKVTTSASGNDTIQASFFNATRAGFQALPTSEGAVTWDVTYTFTDANTYTHLLLYMNGPTSSTEVDAFRMGTSYADVVSLLPAINQQPTPLPAASIYTGYNLSMTVGASSTLPITYQWYKDNGALLNATNATYAVTNVDVSNAGSYYVAVSTPSGTVNSITNVVTVTAAGPAVVTAPADATRYVGGQVTFAPVLSGSLPMQLQWKHGSTDIPNATNAVLTLTNLAAADAGQYVLCATNSLSGIAATPINLTVLTPTADSYEEFVMANHPVAYWRYNDSAAPNVARDLAGGNDALNTNVNYTTGPVPGEFPGFAGDNTAGQFDGTSSISASKVSLMNNRAQFTIVGWFKPAVMPQPGSGNGRVALFGQNDAAELGFHGNNALGIWTPNGGYVAFDPTSMITPGNWYLLAGVGTGSNITFYLNGNQAATGGNTTTNYGSSSSPFRIGSAVLDNSGNFFNGLIDEVAVFDRALSITTLNALFAKAAGVIPPSITKQPKSKSVYEGQTVRFSVEATGTLPFGYTWDGPAVNNGSTISGANSSELVIQSARAADAGNYNVFIENMANWVFSDDASLTILPRPTGGYAGLVASNGPVAWWQLNEAAGSSVAYDYMGGYNGTYGSAATLGVPGPRSTDYAPFSADNTALQTGPALSTVTLPALNLNTNVVTMMAWVYPDGNQGGYRGIVFSRAAGTVSGMHFGDGNELRFTWNDSGSTYGWNSGLVVPTNEWSLVVLTVTPTNGTLYLGNRGHIRSATTAVTNAIQGFAGATVIGEDPFGGRVVNGRIDEVAIFNRALTSRQVTDFYLTAVAGSIRVALTPAPDVVADSKTVGFPHDAVNAGAVWLASLSDGSVERQGVMTFSSATNTQVHIPAQADLNSPTGTISFWMRSSGTAGTGSEGAMIFDRRNGNGDVIVLFDDGSIFVQPEWMFNASSTKKVNDNLWHHIAYVYDQSTNGGVKVYIDGALDISHTNTHAWSWPNSAIELGRSPDSYWKAFDGALDDVRVYNVAMTDAQVAQLVNDTLGEPAGSLATRLNFTQPPGGYFLDWTAGDIQAASNVEGPYVTLPGATPPWPVSKSGAARFFRAVVP